MCRGNGRETRAILAGATSPVYRAIFANDMTPDLQAVAKDSVKALMMIRAYHDSTGRLKVKVALHSSQPLSAFAAVDQITLAWQRSLPNDLASWRGFIPLWRYCQWEVTFAVCP